jgi:hypothetical protein
MAPYSIPDELTGLLAQRRVIPFVGAGFSAALDLPPWEDLLKDLAAEIQGSAGIEPALTHEEMAKACGYDNLQIAEYLYLIGGESIGPIRHALSTALQSTRPMVDSTPHIELTNLGAPYVYTTNFDDLIEKTYRELGLPVDVVAVPRDMALTHGDRTEVVKYHGDLRHEKTLVLTESQYYTRLEFESPMDLKFRSDLLGRSVLFMGYSFRDINIRVIWFRLMQMMQDVPIKDRPPSYIVRLRPNPVLDSLYEAVGLKTVVIDPAGEADTADARNELLADFLLELALKCSPDGRIPGSQARAHLSRGLINQVEAQLDDAQRRQRRFRLGPIRRTRPTVQATATLLARLEQMTSRRMPEELISDVSALQERLSREVDIGMSRPEVAPILIDWFAHNIGATPALTYMVARNLLSAPTRVAILEKTNLRWEIIWGSILSPADLDRLLGTIESEVAGHEDEDEPYTDDDLAFAIDLARRIELGQISGGDPVAVRESAADLVQRAAALFPAAETYEPSPTGRPNPIEIAEQIEQREIEIEEAREAEE